MTDSQSRFAAMPAKQKASVVTFFIIGAFVLYEVIGVVRGGSGGSTTITPAPTAMNSAAPNASAPGGGPTLSSSAPSTPPSAMNHGPTPNNLPSAPPSAGPSSPPPGVAPASHASPLLSKPSVDEAPPAPTPYLAQQDQSQNRYVSAINDLQMLKIQREMAETSQAIIAAKLATVTAEKNISDLLSPDSMGSVSSGVKKGPPIPAGPPPTLELMNTRSAYTVQSVTMELDQWHAVLKYKQKLYDVTVGDTLPTDGSTVTAIDQKGVTLELNDMKQRIPAVSTDPMPGPEMPGDISSPPGAPSSTALAPPGG